MNTWVVFLPVETPPPVPAGVAFTISFAPAVTRVENEGWDTVFDALRTETYLEGVAYGETVTELLTLGRADDPMSGLWEAGDLQWWAALEEGSGTRRDAFWFNEDRRPIAAFTSCIADNHVYTEFLSRPTIDVATFDHLLDLVVWRMLSAEVWAGKQVWITVDERYGALQARLESDGFQHNPVDDMMQMWQRPDAVPESVSLPDGFLFAEDRTRNPDTPLHLTKRNGPVIAEKLQGQSLYRRDLDLSIRTVDGDVAAYCLCWLDIANGVGLFEPVRTEDAFQRLDLGHALMIEGIRRFMTLGAALIKVSRDRSNIAAGRLYSRAGFVDSNAKLRYSLNRGS